MSVDAKHAQYVAHEDRWRAIDDAVAGQAAIKDGGELYLPRPNPADKSKEAADRYQQYLKRAVYYNIPRRTVETLVGAAFRKRPVLDEIPARLEIVGDDIDGAGVSIYQQSQAALCGVLAVGRAGLLVDYPQTAGGASVADLESGAIRPTVVLYRARDIINWRTTRVGARNLLSLVVLAETHSVFDGFIESHQRQYRVLRLTDAGYQQEVWRKNETSGEWELVGGPATILDSAGRPWTEIPFAFVGATNNDHNVDESPLEDIANIAIAHYRNSADYEEAAFLCGQPQPWINGLSEEWRDWMQTQGLYLGSRSPILLPAGGAFDIAQAAPNMTAMEAMAHKEQIMAALGARLLTPGGAVKTATQAQGEQEAEHSVLSLAASNVSEAYTKALQWMGMFIGAEGGSYKINQEFTAPTIDPNMLANQLAAVLAGQMPQSQFWRNLKAAGLMDPEADDEDLREELSAQPAGLNLDG